jgi:membrane protein DedA with SNARE-associated domain
MDALRPYLGWFLAHPYAVVFIGTLVDATGVPFPGRVLLAAAGAFAAAGDVSVAGVIALGALAAVIVDHVWYFGGSLGARPLLALYRRLTRLAMARPPRRLLDVRRYGAATIVLGRFFSSVRLFVWPLARRSGVGYARFLLADAAGALAWTATWVGIGYVVGDNWEPLVSRLGVVMLLVPLAALAAFVTARRSRRARHDAAEP